jgi:hypothetical protein
MGVPETLQAFFPSIFSQAKGIAASSKTSVRSRFKDALADDMNGPGLCMHFAHA